MCNSVILLTQKAEYHPATEGVEMTSINDVSGWFAGRIPDGWFTGAPEVTVDRDEILVVGRLAAPTVGDDAAEETVTAAEESRIEGWRDETREQRIRIALDAERRFGRKVSWGAECGGTKQVFTTASVPVMTRLRMQERRVLDTLVEAGVARSRSHALAWCVHLVGRNESDWIGELRSALTGVEEVRASGPKSKSA